MAKYTWAVLFCWLLLPRFGQAQTQAAYRLVNQGDGIRVERFTDNSDEDRYNHNNTVYAPDHAFTYTFEHISPQGEVFYFENVWPADDWATAWKFVPKDSAGKQTLRRVKISVRHGLQPMVQNYPDYNQTVLQYDYPLGNDKSSFNSSSGAIENEANVWIHPPRDKYFRILELNPFPFVKLPCKPERAWKWNLDVGEAWGDPRWKTWKGMLHLKYTYKIASQEKISTPIGELECWVIQAEARSKIGKTGLVSYFHPQYGFVRLNYTNIDGSKTNLELVSVEG